MTVMIRPANSIDLEALNRVIEQAVTTWNLPERVKRLSLDSYRYRRDDLDHLEIFVAELEDGKIVGVAAIEAADSKDLPPERTGLLLHGLYVEPAQQRRGIGGQLLERALDRVRNKDLDGLLVKAQSDANPFFARQGFEPLAVVDPARDYPHRWWKSV